MHIYYKKCSKHTANILAEIEYDLESALEIYLQFFTD